MSFTAGSCKVWVGFLLICIPFFLYSKYFLPNTDLMENNGVRPVIDLHMIVILTDLQGLKTGDSLVAKSISGGFFV